MKILKCLLMIVTAPVILVLTLFVWLCMGLIYISGLVLGLLAPIEVGASQPRQVWFSFDSTSVLSISELSPCVPRLCYVNVMQLPNAFPHF